MVVRELLAKLGFDIDEKAFKEFEGHMDAAQKGMKTLIGIGVAVQATIGAIADNAAQAGDMFAKNARVMAINQERYQGLLYVAERYGVTQDVVNASLRAFSRRIGAAAAGTGPAVMTYQKLGIALRDQNGVLRDNDSILRDVIGKLSEMEDVSLRTQYADELFSESGRRMVDMLGAGNATIDEMIGHFKEIGYVMGKEATDAAEAYQDTMTDVKTTLTGIKNFVGIKLLPMFQDTIKRLQEWIVQNKELIAIKVEAFIKGFAQAIDRLWSILSFGINIVTWLVDKLGGMERVINLVVLALTVMTGSRIIAGIMALHKALKATAAMTMLMNAAVLLIPTLIAAALVALGLIIEDIYRWVNGQDSLIEKMLGPWVAFKQALIDIWNDPWQAAKDFFTWIFTKLDEMLIWLEKIPFIGDIVRGGRAAAQWVQGVGQDVAAMASPYIQDVTGGSSNTLKVDSNISVAVPPGTPDAQAQYVRNAAKDAVREEWDSIMRQTHADAVGGA